MVPVRFVMNETFAAYFALLFHQFQVHLFDVLCHGRLMFRLYRAQRTLERGLAVFLIVGRHVEHYYATDFAQMLLSLAALAHVLNSGRYGI